LGFWEEKEMVTREENQILEAEQGEEEILQAIKDSYDEGALGPDGFYFLFFQTFWPTIKMILCL
jgi:hypothetical protein